MNCQWLEPPAEVNLSFDDVHVWRASLEQPEARRRRLSRTLAAEEVERAARFHFEKDRRHFIVGRGFLRSVLGRYLKVAPEQLLFAYGARGKPALSAPPSDLHFNLSHAGELALLAVSRGREVGVDLELIRTLADAGQIAARFFSSQENATWCALPETQKTQAFFNCWTRKEAFIKAVGEGLSYPLDQFEVSLAPGEPARLLRVAADSLATTRWTMAALYPAAGYVAAVVAEGRPWRLACWQWCGEHGG